MPIEMLPPHDPNAEAAVLGSLLIDPDAYYEVSDILTPEAFYQAGHRWLYEAIQSLSARQEPPDILAIANELTRAGRLEEAGGLDRIVTLLNSVPTSVNADVYARIVAEKATRRRLIQAARRLIASRSGVRETCSNSHSSRSLSLAPGAMRPSTSRVRNRCATWSCSAPRVRSMMSAMVEAGFCMQKRRNLKRANPRKSGESVCF